MAASAKRMGERHLFRSSDDHVVVKQILTTHSPDCGEIKETLLLNLIKEVLKRATPMTHQTHMEVVEDTADYAAVAGMLKAHANTIHRISCEMNCKCTSGSDAEATTLALFRILSNYTWDAKVVLVLAAFAMNYGDYRLIAQLHTVNPLAKSVSLLMQLPDITERTDILKPRFDAINNLIRAMLDVTNKIIEFNKLPSEYISGSPYMLVAMMDIPASAYWTIRSVIACATQTTMLLRRGREYFSSSIESWELSTLAEKVRNIHWHLTDQLDLCHQYIFYQKLKLLFQTGHADNMNILSALICSKDPFATLPLFNGTKKERVKVDVLKKKTVMFFISDLDISQEELGVLVKIYQEAQEGKPYEIVWLPVTDRHPPWMSPKDEIFNDLASGMPWYSLHDLSLLNPAVIKYIRDDWHFKKKPLLVVLDPQGKVVCPNALHLMWIWDTLDFSFPINVETLWDKQTWQLEFLINKIDREILTKMGKDEFVCLYGGEDVGWIRDFFAALKKVEEVADITFKFKMVYVGKSNQKKRKREAVLAEIKDILDEKNRRYWEEQDVWFFWAKLENMWHSKMQKGKAIENDPILQEVKRMLSFNGSDAGWALISQRSGEMVEAQGQKLIDCLMKIDEWKTTVNEKGFIQALKKVLDSRPIYEHCTHLILPDNTGKITEKMVCIECKRPMEKFILYRCCKD